MVRELEPLVCEERLREFACSAWRRDSFWQAANSSLPMPTRQSQLKQEMSKLDIRGIFFFHHEDRQAVKQVAKRGCEVSILRGSQDHNGSLSPEQPGATLHLAQL